MNDNNFVITIGRQFGSGGRAIGKKLSSLLNIAYYDKELIKEASKRSGVSMDFLEKADEKAPNFLDYALIGSFGNENVLSNGNFYVLQSNVITSIAEERSCVIVGRSADYILRSHPNCINLFIQAPIDYRIQRVCERLQLSKDDAREMIEKQDKSRQKYYDFYTEKEWGTAASYDLCIDSSIMGVHGTALFLKNFIDHVLEKKMGPHYNTSAHVF
ncbi:MAG: cytidylate kinase-like family protein [Bacteroidales bacterium]|nr:cytidylate kinase-like family protein [Bacteroidales bacterium]